MLKQFSFDSKKHALKNYTPGMMVGRNLVVLDELDQEIMKLKWTAVSPLGTQILVSLSRSSQADLSRSIGTTGQLLLQNVPTCINIKYSCITSVVIGTSFIPSTTRENRDCYRKWYARRSTK
jgi:hypothetical protein